MLAEKVGQGTYSCSLMMAASFAPRNIVKSNVCAALGAVARSMMRSKSLLSAVDVYLMT
jgi:hypothetical protein